MGELRRVNTDDDKTVVRILFVPFPQRGNYVDAVVSPICPKFDQHDLARRSASLSGSEFSHISFKSSAHPLAAATWPEAPAAPRLGLRPARNRHRPTFQSLQPHLGCRLSRQPLHRPWPPAQPESPPRGLDRFDLCARIGFKLRRRIRHSQPTNVNPHSKIRKKTRWSRTLRCNILDNRMALPSPTPGGWRRPTEMSVGPIVRVFTVLWPKWM